MEQVVDSVQTENDAQAMVEAQAPRPARKRRTPAEMAQAADAATTVTASDTIYYGKVYHEREGDRPQIQPYTYPKQSLVNAMERIAKSRRMKIRWIKEEDQIEITNPRSGQVEQCNIRMPLDKIVGWAERASTSVQFVGEQKNLTEASAIEFRGGTVDGALVNAAKARNVLAPGIDNQEWGFVIV